MFCTDIMVIQATSLIDSQLDNLLRTRRQANLAEHDAVSAPDNKFNGATNFVQFDTEICQYFGSNTLSFTHKAE
ncbi:hypothetical protein KSB_30980 [Ktedonobacter robiniae]|uniref:Uncharacterized protein n=1 Tax=Ktedonobacter robiniae TaxID=2778365 RepID=A0ABQ3UPI0_9CHLR|nr:hypothetical protein KSB_30980 [Ktedonobacter robiniae]